MTATSFLHLPSEIRNSIYQSALVLSKPIQISENHYFRSPVANYITFALLLTNKTVHQEASSLLYAANVFDISECSVGKAIAFIDRCRPRNASYFNHLLIGFPSLQDPYHGNDAFPEDVEKLFLKISSQCSRLNTITMSLGSAAFMENILDAVESPKIISKAIELVNGRLRTFVSLKRIIIQLYEEGPAATRKCMESYGWVVESHEERNSDYWDDRIDYNSDYDDRYSDDRYSAGDYDIDNDSDFWRRAGD